MKSEAARQGRPDTNQTSAADDSSAFGYWTAADAAELDLLTFELTRGYFEHRERCEACKPGDCPDFLEWRRHLEDCKACRGDAPLTFGPPCSRRAQMVAHGAECPRCNSCPTLTAMVAIVVDWRDGRDLKSKAAWLRRLENEREAA